MDGLDFLVVIARNAVPTRLSGHAIYVILIITSSTTQGHAVELNQNGVKGTGLT